MAIYTLSLTWPSGFSNKLVPSSKQCEWTIETGQRSSHESQRHYFINSMNL